MRRDDGGRALVEAFRQRDKVVSRETLLRALNAGVVVTGVVICGTKSITPVNLSALRAVSLEKGRNALNSH